MERKGKVFYHKGLKYEFKIAKLEQSLQAMPADLYRQTAEYFEYVLSKQFPFDLFNDSKITRCSNFRIKGLKRGGRGRLSRELIETRQVIAVGEEHQEKTESPEKAELSQISDEILALPGYCEKLYSEYTEAYDGQIKPGHDPILSGILMNINHSIAIEVPVWTRKQARLTDFVESEADQFSFAYKKSITGHIDLVMYNTKTQSLTVADYKPEGFFLRSLPQVATYGLMLQRVLKIKDVTCVSFNKEGLWYYKPKILVSSVEEGLQPYPDLKLRWRKYVRGL